MTFLFIGDSITDCGRSYYCDDSFGNGYVMMAAKFFAKRFDKNFKILNRGIGGNKIHDLRNRWKEDCLDLEPDVLTILIGINDLWKPFFWSRPTSNNSFKKDYRAILKQVRHAGVKIILMEPFIIPSNLKMSNPDNLQKRLSEKIAIIREIQAEFNLSLIPLNSIFQEAERTSSTLLSSDGVHPSSEGHKLIAECWLKSFFNSECVIEV